MSQTRATYWSKMLIRIRTWKTGYTFYAYLAGLFKYRRFRQVQAMVLFIGYPRSGSSTLASLLDAHREIIISHEQDILNYLKPFFGKLQLMYLMERNSRLQAASGRISAGYSGQVRGQYNGRTDRLLIIGDKKAGKSTARLEQDEKLISLLQKKSKLPVFCIHIIRNPFDMIATQARRGQRGESPWDLDRAINFCFQKLDTVQKLKSTGNFRILDVYLEKLISAPEPELENLLDNLGIQVYPGYLEACREHLFKVPNRSRNLVAWTSSQRESVEKKIASLEWLKGYEFEE